MNVGRLARDYWADRDESRPVRWLAIEKELAASPGSKKRKKHTLRPQHWGKLL
jgi:hypothetical protein